MICTAAVLILMAALAPPAARPDSAGRLARALSPDTASCLEITEKLGMTIQPRAVRRADAWFGADKARHFAMSYAVVAFGYAGSRLSGLEPGSSRAAAAGAAVTAGFAKEIADYVRGRGFSLRDLAWDFAGLGLGLVVVHQAN